MFFHSQDEAIGVVINRQRLVKTPEGIICNHVLAKRIRETCSELFVCKILPFVEHSPHLTNILHNGYLVFRHRPYLSSKSRNS